MKFTFVSACGKIEERKIYILSLRPESVKVDGCDFPTHVMAPGAVVSLQAALSGH
jgi:hypothetical protein